MEEERQQAFYIVKQALLKVPALGLPDDSRPFYLYVAENRGIAKGVLTQRLGTWKHPVAYLSKKLDPVTAGWPVCLWIMAVVAVLFADKLTLGQNLTVICLGEHCLLAPGLMMSDQRPNDSLSDSVAKLKSGNLHITNGPQLCYQTPKLNPPAHDCQRIPAEDQGW